MKILEIKNLNYSYVNKKVINNLSLSVEEGSFTTIVGNNTSGKTTLIKLICGLLDSKESIVVNYSFIDSNRIHSHSKLFGVVFSNSNNKLLFKDVYSEMAFPLENLSYNEKEIENEIINVAREFKNTKFLDKKIDSLTESEKQELLIMISLLHKPKILLLDSPFTMMTNETKRKIINILNNRIKKEKLTVILTTLDLEEIEQSDYTYVINNGKVVMEGSSKSIYKEEKILTNSGLQLPFMIDLSHKLEFYELISDEILDMEKMVNTLWKK